MSDGHNPYVGVQRTVFEQGWKRGRKDLLKALGTFTRTAVNDHGMSPNLSDIQAWVERMLRDA